MKKNAYILFLLLSPLVLNAQKTNKTINNLISTAIKEYNIPAISASLVTPNKVFYGVGGTTKINGNQKVELNSKFHLGSNTKAITSFIAMKMVENNEIELSTTFIDAFPELKSEIKKEYYNITLSDLLSHKAKIQPYTSGAEYVKLPQLTGTTSKKRYKFTKFVLNETPVTVGTYSNAGYAIASLLLEKKSNLSFKELIKKYMSDLELNYFIGFPNKESNKNPAGHWKENKKWVIHSPNHSYKLADYMLPAGDISMNIIDYSKFIQLHLNGLKKSNSLSKESYQKLHFAFDGYSYGWANFRNKTVSGHDGSAGNYYCHTILIPKFNVAVIVMINSAEPKQQKGIVELREHILKNIKKITNEV